MRIEYPLLILRIAPLRPDQVTGIDVARCRVMESKKKPLWLTLTDSEGKDLVLIVKVRFIPCCVSALTLGVKVGDDLRQDALIMQLLRVMSDLWRREGLDMQMMLYDCISTGHERGLLQVTAPLTRQPRLALMQPMLRHRWS